MVNLHCLFGPVWASLQHQKQFSMVKNKGVAMAIINIIFFNQLKKQFNTW
jgi:hypothetical protein